MNPSRLRRGALATALVGLLATWSGLAVAGEDDPAAAPPPPPPPPPPYEAETVGPPRTAPPPYVEEPLAKPAPLGRRGFQMALRTGLAIPMGLAYSRSAASASVPAATAPMTDVVGWQVPVLLDIGGKPDPHVFVGGYVGFALGEPAGALGRVCDQTVDCLATTFQLGAQVHVSIAPDAWVNPWLGYGLGFSWVAAGNSANDVSLRGFDFAHLMAGVDVRLSRSLGIGPYVDYSLGVYSSRHVAAPAGTFADGDIRGRTLHEWLVIGPRFVFFP